MSARRDCAEMLKRGMSPRQIAQERGVSLKTVLPYLEQQVGALELRRSDIYFSIDREIRQQVEKVLLEYRLERPVRAWDGWTTDPRGVQQYLTWLHPDDIQVCLRYGPVSKHYGDLYDLVRSCELQAHQLVRKALETQFGTGVSGWWSRGVPLPVRKKCVTRREELDAHELDPWLLTDLMDLWDAVDKNWAVFCEYFRAPGTRGKRELHRDFRALNESRNRVMHPLRAMPPTEDDFDTVMDFAHQLEGARATMTPTPPPLPPRKPVSPRVTAISDL